jgi:hypothetical protein
MKGTTDEQSIASNASADDWALCLLRGLPVPGLHPGHTPYLNIDGWGGVMVGSNPQKVLDKFYPNSSQWPHASKYINTRFIWAHSEFTPRQTMRGKALLYSYLYSLYKTGGMNTDVLIADAGRDQSIVDEDEDGKETVILSASRSYSSNSEITSYKWILDENTISTEKNTSIELGIGSYNIILEIEDADGKTASDSIRINIITPALGQKADYDFETSDQLDDWTVENWGEGGVPTASITSERAASGFNSVKVSGNYISNSDIVLKKAGSMNDDIESIIYFVWIPQELVDSSKAAAERDSSTAGGIQNYLMHTGWDWQSKWINLYDLQGNQWNRISFKIPEEVINSEIKEIGLACNVQNAGIGESSIYVDDIIFVVAAPPADYDFETSGQFNDWIVENFGANGGSPVAVHSSEVVHSGGFSYKMEGNFVAGSENALRRNSNLEESVTSLKYNIWVPQELVDSAAAVFDRDESESGIIQNYLMHNGWQWISEVYGIKDLKGNDWNEVELIIPENVVNSTVQAYGVSFKTLGVEIGESAVYIDDIYFIKGDDPTGIEGLTEIPKEFKLFNNYPNPFNPSTVIKYNLPKISKVRLSVYDMLGRRVRTLVNELQNPGSYEINFNASELASGMYIYTLTAGSFSNSQKMLLLK